MFWYVLAHSNRWTSIVALLTLLAMAVFDWAAEFTPILSGWSVMLIPFIGIFAVIIVSEYTPIPRPLYVMFTLAGVSVCAVLVVIRLIAVSTGQELQDETYKYWDIWGLGVVLMLGVIDISRIHRWSDPALYLLTGLALLVAAVAGQTMYTGPWIGTVKLILLIAGAVFSATIARISANQDSPAGMHGYGCYSSTILGIGVMLAIDDYFPVLHWYSTAGMAAIGLFPVWYILRRRALESWED